MRNKLLALILALVMMVGITVMAPVASIAADGVEAIGPDTVTEASTLLMTLNILQGYEDGSLQLDGNITRAEFAAMLARTLRGTDELNLNAGAILNDKMSETPENIAAVKAARKRRNPVRQKSRLRKLRPTRTHPVRALSLQVQGHTTPTSMLPRSSKSLSATLRTRTGAMTMLSS